MKGTKEQYYLWLLVLLWFAIREYQEMTVDRNEIPDDEEALEEAHRFTFFCAFPVNLRFKLNKSKRSMLNKTSKFYNFIIWQLNLQK